MIDYNKSPLRVISFNDQSIASFISDSDSNTDQKTIESFGLEWNAFNSFDDSELENIGNEYFDIINETHINASSNVLDVGCGTGRWSRYIAGKVAHVEAIDPSDAVRNAVQFNSEIKNIRITQAGVDSIPFEDESFDLVFSLGVLHHIPDTQKAMLNCVEKVKKGGHFLVYLYYDLDNRGFLFKALFRFSNLFRRGICKLPFGLKKAVCNTIAFLVYLPLARTGTAFKRLLPRSTFYEKIPLFYYHNKSFHIMKNDALDRFGTPLEQRFTKHEIQEMMTRCGLSEIVFSTKTPYWHAVGKRV